MNDRMSPRLRKLLASGKEFLVISETEPYYLQAYELIRHEELRKGTWTEQDRTNFAAAQFAEIESWKQDGSLPDELRRCGVALERSTNKPAHTQEMASEIVSSMDNGFSKVVELLEENKSLKRQIEVTNTDRDEIWSREKHLLSAVHQLLDNINAERAVTPSKPVWRVVEMIRDILVDTIETHQRTVRETIERDKLRNNASRG